MKVVQVKIMSIFKKIYQKNEEVISYLVFGVLTTLVNLAAFFIFNSLFEVQYLIANAISIAVSILFAFFTNKKYVFKSESLTAQAWLKEFILFCSFRLISAGFDMLSMWILIGGLELDSNLAKLATQFIVVVLNYFFSKWFIFK